MIPRLSHQQQLMIFALSLLIFAGFGVMVYRRLTPVSETISVEMPDTGVQESGQVEIMVHVSGAVNQEGVYKVKSNDRLLDVIALAKGASPLADLSALNLAEKVKDGQKVIVPAKRIPEYQSISGQGNQVNSKSGEKKTQTIINLNSASANELCQVKGLGPTMAQRIVEYREKNGPFAKLEDLTKVKGIGKGKFNKLKEQLCL